MKITSINSTVPEQAAQLLNDDHQLVVNSELVAEANGQQSKIVKWFFGVMLMLIILAGMLFARQGAAFMFGTAGTIIAWVLGLLSIAGLFAFLKGWLPKNLKWVLLILELVNIGYDSYVAGGQWGRPTADNQVVIHLDKRMHTSENFVTNINALWALNNSLVATATTIQTQEDNRDGQGSVWEAAGKMVADFPNHADVAVFYEKISKDTIGQFSSLDEILDYASRYQRKISDQEADFIAEALARKQKAEAFVTYLQEIEDKMASNYREERKANLIGLRSAVQRLANYNLPTEAPATIPLTKAEINNSISWGDHYIIPFLFIVISGTLILILFFWGGKGADRVRFDHEVTLLLANFKLERSGLRHALPGDWFPSIPEQQLLDLTDDAVILAAIKRSGMAYERLLATYLALGQENFVAVLTGTSKWNLGEAVTLAEKQEYSAYLYDIIARLTPKQWELIAKFADSPGSILRLSNDALQNVLLLINLLRTKLHGQDEQVNFAVDRLFVEGADDRYFAVLLRLIDSATNFVQINAITERLVKAITPDTVEYVVAILRSAPTDDRFVEIATKWQQADTMTIETLQRNRLSSTVEGLVHKSIHGGYSLLHSFFESYQQAIQSASSGLNTQTVGVDANALAAAMKINDAEQLRSSFNGIFTVSS